MGRLEYGCPPLSVEIDDRPLAHLKLVIITKLRRQEGLAFSWEYDATREGRSTIWLHPSIPLRFAFSGSRLPALNEKWIEELSRLANSRNGLRLTPEPEG